MSREICEFCDEPIPKERQRHNAKFCSDRCRVRRDLERYHAQNPKTTLPHTTSGAISEYRVIADLLAKGFEVFRSASLSSSCDLAILKDEHLFRVEVRTGRRSATGKIYRPIQKIKTDILATVIPDKIFYEGFSDLPLPPQLSDQSP